MASTDREDIESELYIKSKGIIYLLHVPRRSETLVEMIKDGAETFEEEISWTFLTMKFNEKYNLKVKKDQLALEFQELKQGPMLMM